MQGNADWKEKAWLSLCEDCRSLGPIEDHEIGASSRGCFRCGDISGETHSASNLRVLKTKNANNPDELRKVLAAKMQKIRDAQPTEADIRALKNEVEFLLGVAEGDTGQSTRVRNFLLAWWNAEECGGFDLTDLWNVDMEIVEAIQRILFVLPNYRFYPDRLGFGQRFERIARQRIAARQGVK